MKEAMNFIEDSHGLDPTNYALRMNVFGLDIGWRDLDKDPCYWDDAQTKTHRTKVYNNGRIVILRIKGAEELIIDKPGAGPN